MADDRDKLFPGKIEFRDIKNSRYIGRKPIYDFCIKNSGYIGGEVLDFGCGSMQYAGIFDKADRIIGLDVEGAETIFGIDNKIVYYDGRNIPFDDNCFDSCYSIQAILCIKDYQHSLREIFRVLRPGGYFLITTPFAFPEMSSLPDYTRVTKSRINEELKEVGFDVIELKGSTAAKHTIRRLKIFELRYESRYPMLFWKLYAIYANLMFTLDKDKYKDGALPIDYMALCKKPL